MSVLTQGQEGQVSSSRLYCNWLCLGLAYCPLSHNCSTWTPKDSVAACLKAIPALLTIPSQQVYLKGQNFSPLFFWWWLRVWTAENQSMGSWELPKKISASSEGWNQPAHSPTFFHQNNGKIFCSGISGPEIITIEFRSRFPLILMCHTWYIRDNLEELFQEDTIRDIKVNPYEYKKKIFNNTCRTFFKPGASRDEEYIIGRTLSRWTVTWTRRRTPTSSRRTSSNIHVAPLSKQEHPDKINMSSEGSWAVTHTIRGTPSSVFGSAKEPSKSICCFSCLSVCSNLNSLC